MYKSSDLTVVAVSDRAVSNEYFENYLLTLFEPIWWLLSIVRRFNDRSHRHITSVTEQQNSRSWKYLLQ